MNYKGTRKTIEKILNKEELNANDYMSLAHLVSYLRAMNPVDEYVENMANGITKENELQIITAKEMQEEYIPQLRAKGLHDRLLDCESKVVDGDWRYDRVPADLVQDLLMFLEIMDTEGRT